MKLMASQLQRNKKASKAMTQPKTRTVQPSTTVLEPTNIHETSKHLSLLEDDLSIELQDEYDPLVPNSYELVVRERKEREEKERAKRREERERERLERRRRKSSSSSSSGSDDEEERKKRNRRKDAAAIPPPASLHQPAERAQAERQQSEETKVVESALQELSKTKAKKVNPFAKPKFGLQIMNRYGWKEGQGLGKQSQGISTALSVEKTSKRGGKIVDVAAERELQMEQERRKAEQLAEVMRNPTKILLMQNMVGPGEVDNDLEGEVIEECAKYGETVRCLIYAIPSGASDDEAVRIFVKFARPESAIKAVIDLNGRYFGGRTVKASFFSEERFEKLDLAPEHLTRN